MTDPRPSFHMSAEDFRRHGHAMVDWIADYLYKRVDGLPVLSPVKPGDVASGLPLSAPLKGEPFEQVMADVEKHILPGITHWQSPNFFAFFPANNSGPAILGEMLSAGLGVQGMLWATSPACTEVETRVLDWLVDMLGLPTAFKSTEKGGGVIEDSASSAALCALLAARERATGHTANAQGNPGNLVVYTSGQAHSSIEKGVKIIGLGSQNLRMVEVDETLAMLPAALEEQIGHDIQAGKKPFFVSTTIGTTSSNAMDPLAEIGRICRKHGLWLHVDAAMAGTAMICPEFRPLQEGVEYADSYCFNPHKWMFTNFDCTCFFVADRAALINALSILPEYLRNQATESGAVFDYRDWQLPLGRRFRALKLWFVLRHYGVEGLQHHIRRHVALAREFTSWVEASETFELAASVPLNLVCFRHKAGDEFNQKLLAQLNAGGRLYITHTKLDGKYTLRFVVGQSRTEAEHVRAAWELIVERAQALSAP